MPIAVACECGHGFEVQDKLQGRKLKCPNCSQPVRVGGVSSNNLAKPKTGDQSAKSDLMAFACGCGKRIAAKREWAGKRVKCPGCGKSLRVPGDKTDSQPTAARSSIDSLLDEVGVSNQVAQRCPNCKAEMEAQHVICVRCGFDVERGKKLKTKTYRPTAKQLDMDAGVSEKRSSLPMKLAVTVILLVLVIVAAVLVPKFLG